MMYAGGVRVKPGGDPVGRTEEGINTKAADVVGVSQSRTDRAGALRILTFDTATCGAILAQQSIGTVLNETQGWGSSEHGGICEASIVIAPGRHVATAEVRTAASTQSATIPDARIRITNILDRTFCLFNAFECWSRLPNDFTNSTVPHLCQISHSAAKSMKHLGLGSIPGAGDRHAVG